MLRQSVHATQISPATAHITSPIFTMSASLASRAACALRGVAAHRALVPLASPAIFGAAAPVAPRLSRTFSGMGQRDMSEDAYENPDDAPGLHRRPRAMDVAKSIVSAVNDDRTKLESKVSEGGKRSTEERGGISCAGRRSCGYDGLSSSACVHSIETGT
jgi:hypothetical protein